MNVVMVSTDRGIFTEGSDVRRRMVAHGAICDELHIVVFARAQHGFSPIQLTKNVWAYPTNSISRLLYVRDAIKVSRCILLRIPKPSLGWIVTTQDPFETGFVGWYLKKIWGAFLHVQVHTDIGSPYFREAFLNKIRLLFGRYVLVEADAIRVVSERIKTTLEVEYRVSGDKVFVIPIWVDIEQYSESGSDRGLIHNYSPLILMASRLTQEKNITVAIRAFAKVLGEYGNAGLVIVGEGPMKEKLVSDAKKLNISSNVVFEGWTDNLLAYFQGADMFLLTSDYEGYGRTLVEASAARTPIISTDVGLVGSVLHADTEVLKCLPRDVECLAQCIRKLCSDKELRARVSCKAFERVGQHVGSEAMYLEQIKASLAAPFSNKKT